MPAEATLLDGKTLSDTRHSANANAASHATARAQPWASEYDGYGCTELPQTHADARPAQTAAAVCTAQ